MGIKFIIKQTPVPYWQLIFNDTYFQNRPEATADLSWIAGVFWNSTTMSLTDTAGLEVKDGATWNQGFRPTKIRIDWNASGGGQFSLVGRDTNGDIIFNSGGNYTSGDEIDITWGSFDFDYLTFTCSTGGTTNLGIDSIEFYSL